MGVNLIEDASNESTDIPTKAINLNTVLKNKDQNVEETTDLSTSVNLGSTESSLKADSYLYDKFCLYTRREPRVIGLDAFNRMSDEIVLLVFKWLPKASLARCSLVCKKW